MHVCVVCVGNTDSSVRSVHTAWRVCVECLSFVLIQSCVDVSVCDIACDINLEGARRVSTEVGWRLIRVKTNEQSDVRIP